MAGYFDELAQVRRMLDDRYDDLKSGKVCRWGLSSAMNSQISVMSLAASG
jgi:hypothetical protein